LVNSWHNNLYFVAIDPLIMTELAVSAEYVLSKSTKSLKSVYLD
jgi:hypothetical protein